MVGFIVGSISVIDFFFPDFSRFSKAGGNSVCVEFGVIDCRQIKSKAKVTCSEMRLMHSNLPTGTDVLNYKTRYKLFADKAHRRHSRR